jgi:2-hydroxychromene-2-carboxylate isomerase
LAARRIDELVERTGASVFARPVLFAGLLGANAHKGPAEIPSKRAYTIRDVMRRAARLGLDHHAPPVHPFSPLTALRTAMAIKDEGDRLRHVIALHDAVWSRGLDLTETSTIVEAASTCGLDGVRLLESSREPEAKQRLIDAGEHALALGIFGVPTFVHEEELFWGEDRIEDLVARVTGESPPLDEARVLDFLARPQAHRA